MESTFRWVLVTAIAPVTWGTNYFVTHEYLPAGYPLYGAVCPGIELVTELSL
jgi:probable blue pigment (indigoidine) exporter